MKLKYRTSTLVAIATCSAAMALIGRYGADIEDLAYWLRATRTHHSSMAYYALARAYQNLGLHRLGQEAMDESHRIDESRRRAAKGAAR